MIFALTSMLLTWVSECLGRYTHHRTRRSLWRSTTIRKIMSNITRTVGIQHGIGGKLSPQPQFKLQWQQLAMRLLPVVMENIPKSRISLLWGCPSSRVTPNEETRHLWKNPYAQEIDYHTMILRWQKYQGGLNWGF